MQTREMLDEYIRRYYDDEMSWSRRWCLLLDIPQESYDLLADVQESLCRKPEAQLSNLISREENGERILFFYIRKALRYTILTRPTAGWSSSRGRTVRGRRQREAG